MTQKQIQLTGHIDVPPHRLASVLTALPEHIRLTRLEAGCVSFDVRPDLDHVGRFLVAEVFANKTEFDLHQSRTKSSDWALVTKGISRTYSIVEVE